MVASYRYDAFGNTTSKSGTLADANVYRFSSKEFHVISGMYYYGYRFYDPNLQRWINRDPIGEKGGLNLYGIVGNNPITKIDALGQGPVEDAERFWTIIGISTIVSDTTFIACDCWNLKRGYVRLRRTPGAILLAVTPAGAAAGQVACKGGPFRYHLQIEKPGPSEKCSYNYVIICLGGGGLGA
jgi:RHS repeat-associated protein